MGAYIGAQRRIHSPVRSVNGKLFMKILPQVRPTGLMWWAVMFAVVPMLVAKEPKFTSPETSVWLSAPAKDFTESSPMGNGRLGAMMFGGVEEERIVLNESSVWSGAA